MTANFGSFFENIDGNNLKKLDYVGMVIKK